MMSGSPIVWIFLGLFLFVQVIETKEEFSENLVIRPLPDDDYQVSFDFEVSRSHDMEDSPHYEGLFSKKMGNLFTKHGIDRLKLFMTQGRWNYDIWGAENHAAPPGVLLGVEFKDDFDADADMDVDEQWIALTNSLSGIFGISLKFMDKTKVVSPKFVWIINEDDEDLNYADDNDQGHGQRRMASLSGEAVCWENLTPWLKLLPCKTMGGLGKLLSDVSIFDNKFQTIQISMYLNHSSGALHMKQSFSMIKNIPAEILKSKSKSNSDKIVTNFYLSEVFNVGLQNELNACPLSSESRFVLDTSNMILVDTFHWDEELVNSYHASNKNHLFEIDLKKFVVPINVGFSYYPLTFSDFDVGKELIVNRVIKGSDQNKAALAVTMFNQINESLTIGYFDVLPWFLKIYLNRLELFVNSTLIDSSDPDCLSVEYFSIQPGRINDRPHTLEYILKIPAFTSITFYLPFEKFLLHYDSYPTDPNRGFDIDSAFINIIGNKGSNSVLYSDTHLVVLPMPDFSMVYNVMSLHGTVVTLFFGAFMSLMTRRMNRLTDTARGDFFSDRPMARIVRMATRLGAFFFSGLGKFRKRTKKGIKDAKKD